MLVSSWGSIIIYCTCLVQYICSIFSGFLHSYSLYHNLNHLIQALLRHHSWVVPTAPLNYFLSTGSFILTSNIDISGQYLLQTSWIMRKKTCTNIYQIPTLLNIIITLILWISLFINKYIVSSVTINSYKVSFLNSSNYPLSFLFHPRLGSITSRFDIYIYLNCCSY